MNLQPYQAAGQQIQKQAQKPTNLAKTALTVGATLTGSGIAKRILPLLSKYVSGNIMRKGLEKIDPRLGKFVDNSLNNGYNIDEVRDHLSSKFSQGSAESPQETQGEKSPQVSQHNPLQEFETNYPDISGALVRTMQNGQSPQAAAGILKTSSAFSKQIKQLEKQVGKNFVDYIVELFGTQGQQVQGQKQMDQQMQQQPGEQQPQVQGQGGGIDQQLMAALDKILKM